MTAIQQFREKVGLKFQLYNSLFTSLPFHQIENTGILLSLFLAGCEEGYKKGLSPLQIIDEFMGKHTDYSTTEQRIDLLFRFVQYAERQVVLFDALEDSAFSSIHDLNGPGTMKHLASEVIVANKQEEATRLLKDFSIQLVLTAHPTQFYPGSVLGIIHDLSRALAVDNTRLVNEYLQQLGKTAFFKKKKPTPYDEAISLLWYLENVFYGAIGRIIHFIRKQLPPATDDEIPVIRMGFWPGGDRDGNPFVKAGTTLQVAEALRGSIIKCYYQDVRRMKRRLTFEGVEPLLTELEQKLYQNLFIPGERTDISRKEIIDTLNNIREILLNRHNGLFIHLVEQLLNKVEVFGLYFAGLDIRQESSMHGKVLDQIASVSKALGKDYPKASQEEKIKMLATTRELKEVEALDELSSDTIETVRTIWKIQQMSGEAGCNRYIISHCNSALNVMEVYGLLLLGGGKKEDLRVDIIPLFETVEDLKNASGIMNDLYKNTVYRKHLENRGNRQTIMLGFSDGTKDGGYFMANWSIYKAKEALTSISREFGIDVIFFDGRGGPPARGGGKTHKFYASMGGNISNKEIQLTVQGQTVSSNFGTMDSAQYNIEQLLHAGIYNTIFNARENTFKKEEDELMQQIADLSLKAYLKLKEHPDFLEYLSGISPLKFYGETNIGSRPSKRGSASKLTLKDLRAIPFVGSWSQVKQNVPGFFGVGSAFKQLEEQGSFEKIRKLYEESVFFKTLLDNCEMAMMKSFFPLTRHFEKDERYGKIWTIIHDEYQLTLSYLFKLSGRDELMANYPVEQMSIRMRERIVLPLVTIQQYAIAHYNEDQEEGSDFKKLAMRCSFGIINAGRNSA